MLYMRTPDRDPRRWEEGGGWGHLCYITDSSQSRSFWIIIWTKHLILVIEDGFAEACFIVGNCILFMAKVWNSSDRQYVTFTKNTMALMTLTQMGSLSGQEARSWFTWWCTFLMEVRFNTCNKVISGKWKAS